MKNKTLFYICSAILLIACTEEKSDRQQGGICDPPCQNGESCVNGICLPDSTPTECIPPCQEGETCVSGVCRADDPIIECNPPCRDDETCVNGLCESVCSPKCDPVRQKCDPDTKTCLYIENYCEPGTCSPDKLRFCPAEGGDAGTWDKCPAGESCFHGTCLPDLPTECSTGTCNDQNQACINGSWHQCTASETCTDGRCNPPTDACIPGTCIDSDPSYVCGPDKIPVKCEDSKVCKDGSCIIPASPDQKLLWTICSVNSDCSYGSCIKDLTLSRETENPDNPGVMLSRIPVSKLDPRIPEGKGLCTADCTKDAALCDALSYGDSQYTCQLVYEGSPIYPPKDMNGNEQALPFVNALDADEMLKGIPFSAMCRPFVQSSVYPVHFAKTCTAQSDCRNGTKCLENVCTVPCASDDDCPLTFSCTDDAELGKFCRPDSGTFTACRDKDNDGYGVGHCAHRAVDCDDRDAGTYYSADAPKICSADADTNCNGRFDSHELLGTSEHCEACGETCTMPASKFHRSRTCHIDNGGAELNDYKPETYQFTCLESCAPGFADCNGNISDGCELDIFELSKTDNSIKIYGSDFDKDGFGSNRDGSLNAEDKIVYDKNADDRAFCCADGSKCYGYVKSDNPSIRDRQWIEVDIADYSEIRTDCDDTDPGIHPDAAEICDGIDNNCSGTADEPENLRDGGGGEVDTTTPCDTGKSGICQAGKMRCVENDGAYKIACKADRAAELYEYCNEKNESEDCDDIVDNGTVAVDAEGRPILDEGKGYRMLSPEQDIGSIAANHICIVDKDEFPEAKGKCMYGKYTCDPSRAAEGKAAVYCKSFDPDPVDYIGDNYDGNCDGFDGDLTHTLFVTGPAHHDNLEIGSDQYTADDIKNHAAQKQLHKLPFKTLKQAVLRLISAPDINDVICYKVQADSSVKYYDCADKNCVQIEIIDGIPVPKQTCEAQPRSMDIVLYAGDILEQDIDIPINARHSASFNLLMPKIRLDDKGMPRFKKEYALPQNTKNAWIRIYGGGEYIENAEGEYHWIISDKQSDIHFKIKEDDFYHPSGVAALFNSQSGNNNTNPASLYMKKTTLNASADFEVNADKSNNAAPEDSGKSPATLIGINAIHAAALTLDDVIIRLKAPNGIDGQPGQTASLSNPDHIDLTGLDGGVKIAPSIEKDDYNLDVHYFKKGYILDKNNFNNNVQLPMCNNGKPVNPGHMGGYTRLDEFAYHPLPSETDTELRFSDIIVKQRLFRDLIGVFYPMKEKWGKTEFTNGKLFKRLWGIDYAGNPGRVAMEITSKGVKTPTVDRYNMGYHSDQGTHEAYLRAVCRPVADMIFSTIYGMCNHKYLKDREIRTYQKDGEQLIDIILLRNKDFSGERYYLPKNVSGDIHLTENIVSKQQAVIYPDRYFDGKPQTVESTLPTADTPEGKLDAQPLLLKKFNHNYYFANHEKAALADGQNGENGLGGAGAPVFMPPTSFFTTPIAITGGHLFTDDNVNRLITEMYFETIASLDSDNTSTLGYSLYPTEKINPDDNKIDFGGDLSYSFAAQNLFLGLYDAYTFHLINQHFRDQMNGNESIAYVMGASGGAGGCGGFGGRGGRPGGSAIGVVFAPDKEQAQIDIKTLKLDIKAGSGGRGADGTPGTEGFVGGNAYQIPDTRLPTLAKLDRYGTKLEDSVSKEKYFTPNMITTKGCAGIGGAGGSAGAGAKGGYAMGLIIDCSAVNAGNSELCEKKINFTPPNSYADIATRPGRNGFLADQLPGSGQTSTTLTPGNGGKAAPAASGDPEKELINGEISEIRKVYSDHKIAVIYSVEDNVAKLGTTGLLE